MSELRSRLRVWLMLALPTYLDLNHSHVMSENSLWARKENRPLMLCLLI